MDLQLCVCRCGVGNCGEGASHIVRTILTVIQCKSWGTPVMRVKMLCAIISLTATLSQKQPPYRVITAEVMGNNMLFYGEESYYQELESTANLTLRCLVDIMEKESYNASHELSSLCSRIIKIAKTGLLPQDKYLRSTNDFEMDRANGHKTPNRRLVMVFNLQSFPPHDFDFSILVVQAALAFLHRRRLRLPHESNCSLTSIAEAERQNG
ncbi:hypothetical protein Taro_004425 [Colocasia esculenta]|uniref:Uncharacterized protein n=1 Tax=Colocasia esculenta TaxID=4460 RepID=A0A843TLZ2_COLES|nr:hypothetical protein [Colocasia esculenta]